jgi:hypothetical protein
MLRDAPVGVDERGARAAVAVSGSLARLAVQERADMPTSSGAEGLDVLFDRTLAAFLATY